ncbi:ubiquitin carboxyl-terminal hydrolase [Moniliophthora roreri MCA 2997]|uniref:ubiquitinyl hydrolase 1 n=2 Tax=Moniliophthora roreri TaxID=221103 RepID=V2XZ95_MONRO|nr:ubiquitin carboxyl-terminal hydrolase [Moniliophthora roreri MCA 2997]
MNSETSTSKRHTSGSPRSNPLDTNDEIDAYMADQPNEPEPFPSSSSSPDRLELIRNLMRIPMEVGQTWYLVDRTWYRRWEKACSGEVDKDGPVSEQDLGPVSVSSLLDQYGNLKPGLVEGVDVEYVPQEAWDHLVRWYGRPTTEIARNTVSRGEQKQISLELHPPRFRVLRLSDEATDLLKVDTPSPSYVTLSSHDTLKTLCSRVAKSVSPTQGFMGPHRVWKVDTSADDFDFNFSQYPASRLNADSKNIVHGSDKTIEEALFETDDAFAVEFKDNDWIVDLVGEQPAPKPLFSSSDGFFNRMGPKPFSSTTTKSYDTSITAFGSKSTPTTSTTGKMNGSLSKSLEPGTLGLGNMGNTCFMNSALQCLAHTKELTEYFQSGVFQDELNPDNPLGMQGAIAQAFGALLDRIWASSGPSNSYSPREFKSQLQRFAPQFSGYQQHDSQELVAFLLDGLHEDLNRVLKKPYVEKPDWEGGGDKELMKLAKDSWDGYKLRNDSVIVDLFQGQYQSTLVCPECEKVSITFDPFMYLTLPLPVQKKWRHSIFYIPWDLSKPHVKIPVEISRDSTFKDLRALLARWLSTPESIVDPDNLLTLEIFSNRFYKNLDDTILVSDMGDNDTIVCFELPCHAQQSRTYKDKKSPSDPFVLPLFCVDAPRQGGSTGGNFGSYGGSFSYRGNNVSLFGYPSIAVVTREQAKSVEGIYEAVVERLQRWTKNARDLWTWEVPGSQQSSLLLSDSGSEAGDPVVKIDLMKDGGSTITEIKENGEVVEMRAETAEEEGDIVDEKSMVLVDDPESPPEVLDPNATPVRVSVKRDIFTLKVQKNHKEYGTAQNLTSTGKSDSWEKRKAAMKESEEGTLLLEGDGLYCEWDENMKAYYFGEERVYEHANWDVWSEFIHPEYEESLKKAGEKKNKGITLQDCLDEFTKEEKLGEDDLWYCPRCKKHQQATKRFDLWKVPDILVVHLKRFSNSRMLRDKIDVFVDFPIEGLDLTSMAGERPVAQRLKESGVLEQEFGDEFKMLNTGLDEPLVYDLFAVDEHIGGLGGGHYRAYAQNHLNDKWYHFDDSYVSLAKADEAVNANAYLLFYRRRSTTSLGGKSHDLTEQAKLKPNSHPTETQDANPPLPTPPLVQSNYPQVSYFNDSLSSSDRWGSSSNTIALPLPSPPALEEPPSFEESHNDSLLDGGDIVLDNKNDLKFAFPALAEGNDPHSPTSSVGVEPDLDSDVGDWSRSRTFGSPPAWSDSVQSSGVASPSSSVSEHGVADEDVQRILKEAQEEMEVEGSGLVHGPH